MYISKLISAVFMSLIVWFIYKQQMQAPLSLASAIAVFAMWMLFLGYRERKRTAAVNAKEQLRFTIRAGIWSILYFTVGIAAIGAVFANLPALQDLIEFEGYGGDSLFGKWLGHISLIVVALGATLFITGMLAVTPSAAILATEGRWMDIPRSGLRLLRRTGGQLLLAAQPVLLIIWLALLLDHYFAPTTTFASFLILLFSMTFLTDRGLTETRVANSNIAAGEKTVRWHWSLWLLFVFMVAPLTIMMFMLRLPMLFVYGVVAGAVVFALCYGLVKLRLFAVMKWTFAIAGTVVFAALLFLIAMSLSPVDV